MRAHASGEATEFVDHLKNKWGIEQKINQHAKTHSKASHEVGDGEPDLTARNYFPSLRMNKAPHCWKLHKLSPSYNFIFAVHLVQLTFSFEISFTYFLTSCLSSLWRRSHFSPLLHLCLSVNERRKLISTCQCHRFPQASGTSNTVTFKGVRSVSANYTKL